MITNDEFFQRINNLEQTVSILKEQSEGDDMEVHVIGLCTDICVVSNAELIKAFFPEADVYIDAKCCAGVTPESHKAALATMKSCQMIIENEE